MPPLGMSLLFAQSLRRCSPLPVHLAGSKDLWASAQPIRRQRPLPVHLAGADVVLPAQSSPQVSAACQMKWQGSGAEHFGQTAGHVGYPSDTLVER